MLSQHAPIRDVWHHKRDDNETVPGCFDSPNIRISVAVLPRPRGFFGTSLLIKPLRAASTRWLGKGTTETTNQRLEQQSIAHLTIKSLGIIQSACVKGYRPLKVIKAIVPKLRQPSFERQDRHVWQANPHPGYTMRIAEKDCHHLCTAWELSADSTSQRPHVKKQKRTRYTARNRSSVTH